MKKKFLSLLTLVPLLASCGGDGTFYGHTLKYAGVTNQLGTVSQDETKTKKEKLIENMNNIDWDDVEVGGVKYTFRDHSTADAVIDEMRTVAETNFKEEIGDLTFEFSKKSEEKCIVTKGGEKTTYKVSFDYPEITKLLDDDGDTRYTLYMNKYENGKILDCSVERTSPFGLVTSYAYYFHFPYIERGDNPYSDFNIGWFANFKG